MFCFKTIFATVLHHGKRALFKTSNISNRYSTIINLTESALQESGKRLCYQRFKSVSCPNIVNSSASAGRFHQFLGPMTWRFLQGFIRRVSSPFWIFARKKTAQRLFAETVPYFALVGVTLVPGSEKGLLTEKDQLEALCGDIRDAISRAGWIHDPSYWIENTPVSDSIHDFSLKNLELGPVIDKGCNAVVYSAKWNKLEKLKNEGATLQQPNIASNSKVVEPLTTRTTQVLDFNGIDLTNTINRLPATRTRNISVGEDIDLLVSTGFQQMMTSQSKVKNSHFIASTPDQSSKNEFPLALKMLFNYEAASNAPSILMAMKKELLPARNVQEDLLPFNIKKLPPHSNIVEMMCVFVDQIPLLEGSLELYPQALPKRIHPLGYGRNMSLFCVMKRYDCTLAEYLFKYPTSLRTSCLLLVQLLEAIQHMTKYSVAHRDLKSDNLLVDLSEGFDSPRLVVTDFGCCLTTPSMRAPFPSFEADPRLGNLALMAPEVRESVPGILSSISFEKSDLWSAGAIALEIFGLENPFVSGALNSLTYTENQLPTLPPKTSSVFRHLATALIRRNPYHRPTARVAATVAQLALWGPSKWFHTHSLLLPSHTEVTRWLLCLSTKVLCEAGTGPPADGGGANRLEYEIVSSFLSRIHYEHIIEAITWVRASS